MEQNITKHWTAVESARSGRTTSTSSGSVTLLAVERVRYLSAAYDAIRGELLPEAPAVEEVALAWSFPSKGARGNVIGECHYAVHGSHEKVAIIVHPREWVRSDLAVISVLAHEMLHAALGPGVGHNGPFVALMRRIGLVGKPTATVAGPTFERFVERVRPRLPAFPAGSVALGSGKKAGTRLRLWECSCGVKVRVARDDFAASCDLCGEPFELKQGARPSISSKEVAG